MTHLLITEIFPPKTGGSGRWFWEIFRRLPRARYLIAAGEDPRQEAFDRTHDLHVTRTPLALRSWGLASLRGLWGYGGAIRRLNSLAAANGVQRLHAARCLPEGVMAWALSRWRGIPYSCFVHGEDIGTAATCREYAWLVRRVLNGASFLIANSCNTARLLAEVWGQAGERIRLLHPGVDTERFTPAARNRDVRAQLAWGDRPVVLTAGRLQKRKGQDQMIRALATIRRTIPNVLYAIVGDGEERNALEELARREGLTQHVFFHGELNDAALVGCYQQCDLFVLANREVNGDIEGFGMVLLEAQACGKPVLAGASGGTAETMRIPETGLVVNCDGPDLLASRVTALLADARLRERMGQAARSWVVEQFDWDVLVRQAERILDGPWHVDGSSRPADAERRVPVEATVGQGGS